MHDMEEGREVHERRASGESGFAGRNDIRAWRLAQGICISLLMLEVAIIAILLLITAGKLLQAISVDAWFLLTSIFLLLVALTIVILAVVICANSKSDMKGKDLATVKKSCRFLLSIIGSCAGAISAVYAAMLFLYAYGLKLGLQ